MAYGRKYARKTATPRKSPRTPRGKYTPRKNYRKKMPMVSFQKRVQKIISGNIENKYTQVVAQSNPVAGVQQGTPDQYFFYVWSPGANISGGRMFNLPPDLTQSGRIGNTIKLKRWIIKGIIEPVTDDSEQMLGGMTGYVDIYFGRYTNNIQPVTNDLGGLYQNGNTVKTPTCTSTDQLECLNTDNYKVYYHRRFKMGAQFQETNQATPGLIAPANNDFSLSRTFGFDVCKYICKDRHLKYVDAYGGASPWYPPNDPDIQNLTLWATFSPWTKQSLPQGTGFFKTLYHINALSYAEYEDA